jgi:hypothetical protein
MGKAGVEPRRLFPGITDGARAREMARVIAGWRPGATSAGQARKAKRPAPEINPLLKSKFTGVQRANNRISHESFWHHTVQTRRTALYKCLRCPTLGR